MRIEAPVFKNDFKMEKKSPHLRKIKTFIQNKLEGRILYTFNNMMMVDYGYYFVYIPENTDTLVLAFNVDADPGEAAAISSFFSSYVKKKKLNLKFWESYYIVIDENNFITAFTTGKDAYRAVGREPMFYP